MSFLLKALLLVAYLVVGFTGFLYIKQRDLMYYPMGNKRPNIANAGDMKVITVTTADGLDLEAWYRPPDNADMPTVLFFHGNGGNIEFRPAKMRNFTEEGYGVLLAEYRGYGGNPGAPTETGLYNDAEAYLEWLVEKRGAANENIILYGESLGSGVAVEMAVAHEVKAVILDVPMSSAIDIARFHYPFLPIMGFMMRDKYDSISKIAKVDAPLLIGVGGRDEIIPPKFGRKLFDAAKEPKTFKLYPQANHADIHAHGFAEDMMVFVKGL